MVSLVNQTQTLYGIYLGIGVGIILIITLIIVLSHHFHFPRRKRLHGYSYKVRYKYNTSNFAILVEIFVCAIAITSFVFFVLFTVEVSRIKKKSSDPNFDEAEYKNLFETHWIIALEFVFSVILIFDYILHFYTATTSRLRFILSFNSFAQIFNLLPAVFGIFSGFYFYGFEHLRIIRIYQTLLFFRHYKRTQRLFDPEKGVIGQVIIIAYTVLMLILSMAGFIFVVENNTINPIGEVTSYYNSIYYTVTSITTVGYGDIVPTTVFGKLVFMFFVLLSFAVLSVQLNALIVLIKRKRNRHRRKFQGEPHLLVIVHDPNSVLHFLSEFYHEERGGEKTAMKVCFLNQEGELSLQLKRILSIPPMSYRTDLLRGSALINSDLERCKLKEATACFIMSNKFVTNIEEEDARTIMEVLAVRNYKPDVKLFVQVHLRKSMMAIQDANTTVFTLSEVRLAMTSQGVLCPGFLPFIGNLTKSFASPVKEVQFGDWKSEYLFGCGNEVYVSKYLSNFVGMHFGETVRIIFKETGALLFGIAKLKGERIKFTCNPGNSYVIKSSDKGVLLAQNRKVVKQIQTINPSQIFPDNYQESSIPFIPPKEKESFQKQKVLPKTLEQATLKNASHLQDHFIIISNYFSEVSKIVCNLSKYLRGNSTLTCLIVSDNLPTEEEWEITSRDDADMYVMKANPNDPAELVRIGTENALAVVILSLREDHTSDPTVDGRNIATFRNIRKRYLSLFTVIELVHNHNVRFLGLISKSGNISENPYYASGAVFVTETADYLLVHAYFDPFAEEWFGSFMDGILISLSVGECFTFIEGRIFGDLLASLLSQDLLPLALYRYSPEMKLRYLMTNPPFNTPLRIDDYVLAIEKQNHPKEEKEESPHELEVLVTETMYYPS